MTTKTKLWIGAGVILMGLWANIAYTRTLSENHPAYMERAAAAAEAPDAAGPVYRAGHIRCHGSVCTVVVRWANTGRPAGVNEYDCAEEPCKLLEERPR